MALTLDSNGPVSTDGTYSAPITLTELNVGVPVTLDLPVHEGTTTAVTVSVVAEGSTYPFSPLSGYEVSADNETYAASVEIPALTADAIVYVRKTDLNASDRAGLAVVYGGIQTVNQPPAAFTPTAVATDYQTVTVTASTTDPDGDTIVYRVAVTTSATPPSDWSGYTDKTAAQMAAGVAVTGLTGSTNYYGHVRAYDGYDATVGISAQVTTPIQPDITPPVISGTLTATAGNAQVTLVGPTATDNVGIAKWQYRVDAGAWVDIASTSGTMPSTVVSGLTNGQSYTFDVRALDAAGNASDNRSASATPVAFSLPDEFNGTAGAAPDAAFWTVVKTANGTAQLDGSGNLVINSPAATDAASVWRTTPINHTATKTYKAKVRVASTSPAPNGLAARLLGIAQIASPQNTQQFPVTMHYTASTFNKLFFVYTSASGEGTYWNGSAWAGDVVGLTISLDTDYVAIIETGASGVRWTLKNADETSTIYQTTWIPWSSIIDYSGANRYIVMGEANAAAGAGKLTAAWYDEP